MSLNNPKAGLSQIVTQVSKLKTRFSLMPSFRWGVVAGIRPLRLHLDMDPAPLAGTPATIVAGLRVGDRVLVMHQNLRSIVVGRGKGDIIGSIIMYAGADVPDGYLRCDGSEVSRTAFAQLFSVIGERFGAGDGETTFRLPDFGGRGPMGWQENDGIFGIVGASGGARTHTLTTAEMPSHTHNFWYVNQGLSELPFTIQINGSSLGFTAGTVANNNRVSIAHAGGGAAHNNLQPYLTVPFLIRA